MNKNTQRKRTRPTMRPETALTLFLMDVGFTLTLEELRSAWTIASDRDRRLIARYVEHMKQVMA